MTKEAKNRTTAEQGNESANHGNSRRQDEMNKFQKMADQWWDPNGAFRPLHELNPVRVDYILAQWRQHQEQLSAQNDKAGDKPNPAANHSLSGKKILDVGCGGGLLAVALNNLGGDITAIDAEETTIGVARAHQEKHKLNDRLTFSQASPEDLLQDKKNIAAFDLVLAMEVIEHVAHPADFVATLKKLVKPNGLVIFSTINRNPQSFLLAIIGAEYVLNLLPRGTHQYEQFVRPEELSGFCRSAGLKPRDATGLVYNPLLKTAKLAKHNLKVNYFLTATL
ncbi:MAG: bifunctional 2-polyprenyl-6-hydroxyphenol methylase/3-demethylubiquinol 3-O-methyltransferase UbiG [Hydrotalea sp.]|nr:bifunctional 2-polyprenyl-6-hydroxyphenol methylase/3-demethylubiquinol 3-O-methyltransferase UbiG [Hydrotalea sp.]